MSAPNSTADYYELLQVSPLASPEVIEAAYKGLEKKYSSDPDPAVRERRRGLEEAYRVLSNTDRRAAYDAARNGASTAASAAAAAAAAPPPVRLGGTTITQCTRHPETQTALRCSRCETPICPRCMIQTPVGARCPDCAKVNRSPVYTVRGQYLARAIAAGIGGGFVMGTIWGFASQNVVGLAYGGLSFMSLLLGVALGYAFTRLMDFATRRKRGPVIVACAMGGIVLATLIQIGMVDGPVFVGSVIAAGVGLYFSYQNLR
jgi:hypothetical protein